MEENGTPGYTTATTEEPALFGELRDDHQKVKEMLTELASVTDQDEARDRLQNIREALVPHMRAEETVFYPAVAAAAGQETVRTAANEHRQASQLLTQLQSMSASDPAFAQRVTSLRQAIETHVAREEGQIFPTAARAMSAQQWDQLEEQFDRTKQATLDTLQQGGAARTTNGRTGTATPTTPAY